jgi:hypothetical protein
MRKRCPIDEANVAGPALLAVGISRKTKGSEGAVPMVGDAEPEQ